MENTVRKVNYMEIKTVIWDQHGYKHLGLTRQIPRDQATCVEKSLENSQRVGRRHLDAREEKKFIQNIIVISENIPEDKKMLIRIRRSWGAANIFFGRMQTRLIKSVAISTFD